MDMEERRVLKKVLGSELWMKVEQDSTDTEHFLHLYHETGRDDERFRELVDKYFTAVEPIDTNIELYREIIEKQEELKVGVLQDVETLPEKEELLKIIEEEIEGER